MLRSALQNYSKEHHQQNITMMNPDSKLDIDGCAYCAPLFINSEQRGMHYVPIHKETLARNGTVTFIHLDGITYAVTCWHVVAALRSSLGVGPEYQFLISRSGFYPLLDRFVAPELGKDQFDIATIKDVHASEALLSGNADVAIRPIPSDILKNIRKRAIHLEDFIDRPIGMISHGIASGFPECECSDTGTAVLTTCGSIVAAVASKGSCLGALKNILFRSEVAGQSAFPNFSGLSGGPVLWQSEKDKMSGFIGILHEGMPPNNTEIPMFAAGAPGNYPITFRALVIAPESFRRWVVDCGEILAENNLKNWWP